MTPALDTFAVSTVVVALGEIGDKTQLLALLLSARFRRPMPIIFGILVATLANHVLAGAVGAWVRNAIPEKELRWILAASFFAMAAWSLKVDTFDESEAKPRSHWGVFGVTVTTFFLAEMGDKTQVATAMLAAQFSSLFAVVAGTTLGMMLADVPVVFLAQATAKRLPYRAIRYVAALVFVALGIASLVTG